MMVTQRPDADLLSALATSMKWLEGPKGRWLLLPLTIKGWFLRRRYVRGAENEIPSALFIDQDGVYQYIRAANRLRAGDVVWCGRSEVGTAVGNVSWGYYGFIQRSRTSS